MNDKKNGKGTYIWKSGVKYVGSFENDYRHGYGEMFWQDGKAYKGEWINGIEANKIIKIDQFATVGGKPHARGDSQHGVGRENQIRGQAVSSSLPKASFRTIQTGHSAHRGSTRHKLPMDRLKSIYNPSNNMN